ncbi:MAG: hypothetical protein C4530_19290 [Desulfobacteraceae bacterium]|nr:MAG: hypothetical protein C4530_19290 [Desulfobacteraceae bacterium]
MRAETKAPEFPRLHPFLLKYFQLANEKNWVWPYAPIGEISYPNIRLLLMDMEVFIRYSASEFTLIVRLLVSISHRSTPEKSRRRRMRIHRKEEICRPFRR